MLLVSLLFANLLLVSAEVNSIDGYCGIESKKCSETGGKIINKKLIFYDVNPPEGFNLRRDVYMRFAIMLAEARKSGSKLSWHLVLPPWYNIYHWKSQPREAAPKPWSLFFDLSSLKSYAPVLEMHEVFTETSSKGLEIDTLYVLQNYEDAFINGVFEEKWEIVGPCEYDGFFWGYNNITVKEIICVRFQGKISQIWELMVTHLTDEKVMFAHGEIPLHDHYGTKTFWDCRKSMKFNRQLVKSAERYISADLKCFTRKCPNYISVHWRRQDFARYRKNDIPSIAGTARQIDKAIRKNKLITKKVFIATDAPDSERNELEKELKKYKLTAYFYTPDKDEEYSNGEIAIIDQIVCSRSAYFIGTHESTFSFRIQEEREILGFDSKTTYNRLCPDRGNCETPSKWTIVND